METVRTAERADKECDVVELHEVKKNTKGNMRL